MFKFMMLNYVILTLVQSIEWELVVDDLNTANFATGSWQFRDQCVNGGNPNTVTGNVGTCTTNTNNYLQMQDNIMRVRQTFNNDIPHYEIRVVTDFYLVGVTGTLTTEVYVENNSEFSFSYTTASLLDYRSVCFTAGGSSDFQIRTYTVDASHQSNQNIKVQYCTSINAAGLSVGVRNVQVYIHRCYYTCSSCSGPNSNNCTNCYYGSNASTCQPCSTSTTGSRFIDYTVNLNCQMECNRNGKLADSNYVCQNEPRISQQETYFTGSFTSYSDPPWKFIADPLFFDPTVPTSKVSTCATSTKFMGFFRFNEAMEFSLALTSLVQYIRLRITFYISTGWAENTSIQVLMDEIPMVVVKSVSGVIQLTNAIKISTGSCGSYTTYRIEAIIQKTSNSPKMKLKGNMDVTTTQSWGFSDFYVDVAVCQTNCSVCKNNEECYTCVATYRVYKGTCVQTCPPYSYSSTNAQGNVCIDFDEETAQSQYLVKAFYDTTTTDDEVVALVGTVTTTGSPNFQTNSAYYWSYIPGKRVLGGSLVWYKAQFVKSFSIPNPHYEVHVRMRVILGDGMSGNFYYSFPTLSNITVTTSNSGTTSNLWGKAANEKTIPLDFTVPHSTGTFSVTLHCQSVVSFIYDGFCAVSDYFLVVNYCAPYCNACTGLNPGDCTSIQSLPANMLTFNPLKCNDNYFLDKSVLPYICTQCATGCQECTSLTVCTICKTTFYMIANTCYCNQGLYLSGASCSNCNSICQNCYSADSNQCLSCYPQHYRYLSKNVCLCNPYYYDDGINLTCQPICGDMIVVEGEVCDDGNDVPFDGCHKCQYSCQLECSNCVLGNCLKCTSGWQLNLQTKKCQSICGDLQTAGNEECDDGNITPYDGCYQCKYQCDARCSSCVYGKCQSCDSANGWVLNESLSICESQCGDLIVVQTEQCDDSNLYPFDGCLSCAYSCPIECSVCTLGQCQQCIQGYTYSSQLKSCQMTCGDALKLPNEACDDGNQAPYDGCYECQYSCQPECTSCVQGICQACNTSGWELNKYNKCQPKCGDGIITLEIEQCDDGNDTPFDGCYQCKESCQAECLNCHQGQCRMCIQNFYLNTQDYQCYPKCGDMLVVSDEECDDGNNIDFDGCSNCKNQCQPTCTRCVGGICSECNINGYYLSSTQKCESFCGDTIIVDTEECDDGNNEEFDGCFQCKWQCQEECLTCGRGICEKCKDGYYLEGGICSSICGDNIITQGEQCDDGNYLSSDGCYHCQFQCQEECTNCVLGICYSCQVGFSLATDKRCQSICGDGILTKYEECDEIERDNIHTFQSQCYKCKLQCQSSCLTCSLGICLNCDESQGWYLNQGVCETKCTDLVVAGNEECEGTIGCKQCNFDCPTDCQECIYGVCQQCKIGFNLQDNNTCSSICGDSYIISYELCDDDNLNPFDGCFSCLFSCEAECSLCYQGQCQQCLEGYQLTNQGHCEPQCGDQIVLAIEQCDDGNLVSYDGCQECKYQCQLECVQCWLGICYECQFGFELNEVYQCLSICGDQYVTQIEQCDDGNLIANDGCHLCQFDYQLECIVGNEGLCIQCSDGYYLNNQSQCNAICGDGIIVSNEQCDDSNYLQFDGCYQCQFQCQFECSDCIEGICHNCIDGYTLNTKNQCDSICGDNIRTQEEECDDNSLECSQCTFQCKFGCKACVYGICYQCLDGWYLDEHSICQSQCGDKQLTVLEQCDDGNLSQNDGCNQCQFQCSLHCLNCSYGICSLCDVGYQLVQLDYYNQCEHICGDMIVVESEQCDDGNITSQDGCDLCQFSCVELCDNCIQGVCLSCQQGYQLNLDNQCISICGDQIVVQNEFCDDGNQDEFDGCFQCLYSCQQECYTCFEGQCIQCREGYELNLDDQCVTVCGDQMVNGQEQCDDGNLLAFDGCFECQFDCQSQCQICIDAKCLQCNNELGWYLNSFGFCETICGDNIVVSGVEQCDDGNEIRYDGCYECKFECQSVCTQCIEIACHECNIPGWYLIDTMCYPQCGDSIAVDQEQCDDGNDEMYDGCYDCEFQCEQKCNQCINGVCFGCVLGWAIDPLNVCETVCGDSIVISPQEDCDDGNVEPYDGCYECSYQCEELCTTCIEGVCYDCDNLGWQINDEHKCEPICNDGLVIGIEECDDMNLIPYDGCFECKFQCHQQCLECEKGVCLTCDYGYYPYLGQCQSFCGDGQMADLEECDDNNLKDMDGCSKECKIEENWFCITKEHDISQCIYSKTPELILSLMDSNSTDKQIVSLKFDVEMKMISNSIQPQFSFRILNLLDTDYTILLSPMIPFKIQAQFVEYDLFINFNISVYSPTLFVDISNISNQYEQTFKSIQGTIKLEDVEVISESEKQATLAAQSFSQVVMYTMVGIAALALMTGSLEMVWNLLDMVQLLSYIKYVNINFPLNLDTYFEIFKLVTISPLLKLLGVDFILSALNDGESPYIETQNKFKDDQINAYFLGNFSSFLLCFILAYANYFVSLILSKLLYKLGPWALRKLNFTLLKAVHKTRIFFKKNAQKFYYSSLMRIFLANYYDIMFAACIQVNNLNWDSVNMSLNSAISILVLGGQAYFIFNVASKLTSFTNNTTVSNKTKYDSIFEGVKDNNANFWGMQLNSVLLLKKFMFMVIIVNCQGDGVIQTIYVSISSTMYLAYLIKTKPFNQKSELIKQIINESAISFNALTFLIYKYQRLLQLDHSQVMIMGWIHIASFSGILCSTLLIDLYNQMLYIFNKIKSQLSQKEEVPAPLFY